MKIEYYILLSISALISALSQILLKKSANHRHSGLLSEYLNPLVIVAYFLFFGVMLFNIYIFTLVEYKFGIVINSFSTIFVLILSNHLLNEKITSRKVIGNILIFLGIVVFSLF